MAIRAIRDTFGVATFPTATGSVEARHRVFAGDRVPPGMVCPPGDVADDDVYGTGVLGEPPAPGTPAPSVRSGGRRRVVPGEDA